MDLLEKNIDTFTRVVAKRAGRLVAKIATKGGSRRPVGWTLDSFFLGIVEGLEAEGVSRKVTADMFGITTRTLHRRLDASKKGNEPHRSEWVKLSNYVREHGSQSREQLSVEFPAISAEVLASLVRDLVNAGIFAEEGPKVVHTKPGVQLSETELEELIVRMHHYFEWYADEIASVTGVDLDHVEEVLSRPVAEKWQVDENTVWVLMPEAVNRAYDFLEGRVASKAEDHRGIVLNVRIDHLADDAKTLLRETVQECVGRLQQVVNEHGNVNETYPEQIVREWSVVLMENFNTSRDLSES